jgi:hypothetical protein
MYQIRLVHFVLHSDFCIVCNAIDWHEAIAALRKAHTNIDDVSGLNLHYEMYQLSLWQTEHPLDLISRARTIQSKLYTVNSPMEDMQVVSVIVMALRKNTLWGSKIDHFVSTPGFQITLEGM